MTPTNDSTEDIADTLLRLLEEQTRAEIMARHGTLDISGTCYMKAVDLQNEIRKLLYGTDCLVELGLRWNLLKERSQNGRKS